MSQLPILKSVSGLPGADLINGEYFTIHTAVNPNYGNIVANDSGLTNDPNKILSMPGYYDWWPCEPYDEMFDDDRSVATICWEGPWSNRLQWMQWVLGYTTVVNSGVAILKAGPVAANASPSLSRVIPHQHPEMPWLYATDCKLVKGKGAIFNRDDLVVLKGGNAVNGPDGEPAFNPMLAYGEPGPGGTMPWGDGKCVYAVTYRALDYEVLNDTDIAAAPWNGSELGRYVTRLANPSVKVLGLPPTSKNSFVFTAGPASIIGKVVTTAELPLIQPMKQLEYIWHEVPSVNWQVIDSLVGSVNNVTFDPNNPLGFFPPAGTLLCQGYKPQRYRTKAGRIAHRISFRMDYLGSGWNSYPAPDGNYYSAAFASGRTLYPTNDLNQLFAIGSNG